METNNFNRVIKIQDDGDLDLLTNKAFSDRMRMIGSDKYDAVQVSNELWIKLADRVENSQILPNDIDKSRLVEIELLKKELAEVVRRNEELERKVEMLNQVCDEGGAITEFYRGKNEAYEFAFRCLGGKDGT